MSLYLQFCKKGARHTCQYSHKYTQATFHDFKPLNLIAAADAARGSMALIMPLIIIMDLRARPTHCQDDRIGPEAWEHGSGSEHSQAARPVGEASLPKGPCKYMVYT